MIDQDTIDNAIKTLNKLMEDGTGDIQLEAAKFVLEIAAAESEAERQEAKKDRTSARRQPQRTGLPEVTKESNRLGPLAGKSVRGGGD